MINSEMLTGTLVDLAQEANYNKPYWFKVFRACKWKTSVHVQSRRQPLDTIKKHSESPN